MKPRPPRGLSIEARLLALSIPEPNTGCWLWLGDTSRGGYGSLTLMTPHKHRASAHRLSWELVNGPIPAGLVIDHKCRMRSCINPSHLRVVTTRENILCGISAPAQFVLRDHCAAGHAYDAANTRHTSRGRECRACGREKSRRQRQRKRGTLALPPSDF